MTFVDTSALLAFLDRDAARHAEVVAAMTDVLTQRSGVTHDYIVIAHDGEAHVERRASAEVGGVGVGRSGVQVGRQS